MRIYKSLVTVDFERDDNQMIKQNKVKVLVAYLIAFFSLWSLVELVLFEKITDKNAFNGKKILPHNQRKGAENSAPKNL